MASMRAVFENDDLLELILHHAELAPREFVWGQPREQGVAQRLSARRGARAARFTPSPLASAMVRTAPLPPRDHVRAFASS